MDAFNRFLKGEVSLRFNSLSELKDFMRRCDAIGVRYGQYQYLYSHIKHYMLNPSPVASPVVGFSPISGHIHLVFAGFKDPGVATYAMQKEGFLWSM